MCVCVRAFLQTVISSAAYMSSAHPVCACLGGPGRIMVEGMSGRAACVLLLMVRSITALPPSFLYLSAVTGPGDEGQAREGGREGRKRHKSIKSSEMRPKRRKIVLIYFLTLVCFFYC